MTPKSTLAILALFGAMSTMQSNRGTNDGSIGHGIPDKPKKIIPKGAKEFTYRGVTVTALNERRAHAKIERMLQKANKK